MNEERKIANYHIGHMTTFTRIIKADGFGTIVEFEVDEQVIVLATIVDEHKKAIRCVIMKDDSTFESCTVNATSVQLRGFGVNVLKIMND